MKILFIDTSEKNSLVSVISDGVPFSCKNDNGEKTHATNLLPNIDEVLVESGLTLKDVDLFSVANGPGSYTGLRIAIATAETLAFGNDKLIVPINTLDYIAGAVNTDKDFIVSMIDARNTLNYWRVYRNDKNLTPITGVMSDYSCDICLKLKDMLCESVCFTGSGSIISSEIINEKMKGLDFNILASDNFSLSKSAYNLAIKTYSEKDKTEFLPNKVRAEYYKDVHVTVKKND